MTPQKTVNEVANSFFFLWTDIHYCVFLPVKYVPKQRNDLNKVLISAMLDSYQISRYLAGPDLRDLIGQNLWVSHMIGLNLSGGRSYANRF